MFLSFNKKSMKALLYSVLALTLMAQPPSETDEPEIRYQDIFNFPVEITQHDPHPHHGFEEWYDAQEADNSLSDSMSELSVSVSEDSQPSWREKYLKPRLKLHQHDAEDFLHKTHLPSSFLDKLMQYFKLMNAARVETAEERERFVKESGYQMQYFIETRKTKLRAVIASKQLTSGKYDVAVVIPGTRRNRHWILNARQSLEKTCN